VNLVGNWQEIDAHAFTTAVMDRNDAFHVLVLPIHKRRRQLGLDGDAR